jgi:pyruvate kinase
VPTRYHARTKIVGTLGPASTAPETLRGLIDAGLNVARINFSHGTHEQHAERIRLVREAAKEAGVPVAVLGDLQGPRIRIGDLSTPVPLAAGDDVVLYPEGEDAPADATATNLPITYEALADDVGQGDRVLVDDGLIELTVLDVQGRRVRARVVHGGPVKSHKGMNLPGVNVSAPSLTEKDRADVQFAIAHDVDYLALSFVRRAEDVEELRAMLPKHILIVAKIEKDQALDNIEEILRASDGVMVARGDLGVELPPEQVPPLQNKIVACARQFGKPVVVATQMLESMITSPTPTRAEVSDVATAIYDGADAVMLSAESAAGKYPLEAVAMTDRIANSVERDPVYSSRIHFTETRLEPTIADALSGSSRQIAGTVNAKAMVVFSKSGSTARRIARERAPVPILAMSPSQTTSRRMGLYWGVHSVHSRDVSAFEEMVGKAKRMALRHHLATGGDRIVIMAGIPFGTAGSTNVLHVVRLIGDELERHSTPE